MTKKAKNPYPRSFAKRLTWRIMLLLFVVMGLTSLLIFFAARGTIYGGAVMFCNSTLDSKAKEIQQQLSDVYVASINSESEIVRNLSNPGRMHEIMKRIVRLNPHIRSCGISFTENYYPEKGRWFCPYAIRKDSSEIETRTIGDAEHDYLNAKWFRQALTAKEGYWSAPFLDGSDNETPLVSYILPIRNQAGKTIAVLGADILLRKLGHDIQVNLGAGENSVRIEQDSDDFLTSQFPFYYFVIDSTGTYVLHPEPDRPVRKNYFAYVKQPADSLAKEVGKMMVAGDDGFYSSDHKGHDLTLEGKKVVTFFMPIQHTSWSICLVVSQLLIDILGYVLGGLMLFLILTGLFVVFLFGRIVIKRSVMPIKHLAASADEVAKGNFSTPLPPLKSRDEIQMLRDSFEKMQHSLTQYVEELKTTTAQKASIESELKVAHEIQMSMLPKTFPPFPERSDIDIYGLLTPAKAVGGDLFDFYIQDDTLFFCIGDVSGKGVPASMFMAVTRSLFRNVSHRIKEPHLVCNAINESMSQGNEMYMFVTLFVGVLNLKTGLLRYCNAGHNPPLLIGQDVSLLPCESNTAIGLFPEMEFVEQEVTLEPQTTLFLFTDGLNEAQDSQYAQFGDDRIMSVAEAWHRDGQVKTETLITKMGEAVHAFVGDAEQSDDLTMLAITRN